VQATPSSPVAAAIIPLPGKTRRGRRYHPVATRRRRYFRLADSEFGLKKNERTHVRCHKYFEPRLGGAGKFHGPAAPGEPHGAGVQGVMRQNEAGALFVGQAIFDQRQIYILVAAVEFIADDGMAEMGEVDANLVLAPGAGDQAKQ
jgi:hypothetical protein